MKYKVTLLVPRCITVLATDHEAARRRAAAIVRNNDTIVEEYGITVLESTEIKEPEQLF